jgi:hypothetical protein
MKNKDSEIEVLESPKQRKIRKLRKRAKKASGGEK